MLHVLSASEPIVIDLDRLHLGQNPIAATGPGWDPVDALIAALCEAEVAWADARLPALSELADIVSRRAGALGMTTFATVAEQTSDLAKGRDAVALAASLARLVRVGEASLVAILEMEERRL